MLKFGVTTFQITIDGSRKIHNCNRPFKDGSGSLDCILENLTRIKTSNENFAIILRVNIDRNFYYDINNFEEQVMSKFKKDSRFKFNFHAIVDYNTMNKNITSNEILDIDGIFIKKAIIF